MNNFRRAGMNLALATVIFWLLSGSSPAADNGKEKTFRARLDGSHETPAISTNAR